MEVSLDVLEQLICSQCQNYLSYFPAYISTDDRNICGRCAQSAQKNYIRNNVYETVCKQIYFPCRYLNEGCVEKVLPKEMPSHEKSCTFRTLKCPTAEFTRCVWKGSRPNLVQHCKDKHSDCILKNGKFQLEFSKSKNCENLLEFNEAFVMFSRNFDWSTNVLKYYVHQLEDETTVDNRSYKIVFEHGGSNLSIENYLSGYDQKRMSEICLDVLKVSDEIQVINCKIDFKCTPPQNMLSSFERINEALLSQLRCTICKQYLMPPLDQYLRPCVECRAKYPSSLSVESVNYPKLDTVANLLNYPCKFKTNGCNFESQPPQMKDHQKNCSYEDQVCPLNEFVHCKWNGLKKDVQNHVQEDHVNMILNSTEISELLTEEFDCEHYFLEQLFEAVSNPELIKCYVIKFSNNLFRLTFSWTDGNFRWAMHKIGNGHSQNRFKYEIEITDRNKAERKLLVRQVCATEPAKKDVVFTNAEGCCYFQRDQIESLFNQNTITFRVHIVV